MTDLSTGVNQKFTRWVFVLLCSIVVLSVGVVGIHLRESQSYIELSGLTVIAPDLKLPKVRDLLVTPGDTIWVLSGDLPVVTQMIRSGRVLTQFGVTADSSGSFRNPWSLVRSPYPNSIGVWDIALREVFYYSTAGGILGRAAIPLSEGVVRGDIREVSYGFPQRVRSSGTGFLLEDEPRGVTQTRDYAQLILVRLDAAGVASDTMVNFSRRMSHANDRNFGASALVPIPLWANCDDGTVPFFEPRSSSLLRFNGAGSLIDVQQVAISTKKITERDVFRHVLHIAGRSALGGDTVSNEMRDEAARIAQRRRRDFGRSAPPAVDIICASNGEVWLQQFSTDDHSLGFGREWIVLRSPNNFERVRFPRGFQPNHIGPKGATGVFSNDIGQSLAYIALPPK